MPDGGDQTDAHYHVDARDRHQPRDVRIGTGFARELPLDDVQVLGQPIVLAQVPSNRVGLVAGKRLRQQPRPTSRPEQIGVRTGRYHVSVQDRLHDRLQPSPLPHDLDATRHLPT